MTMQLQPETLRHLDKLERLNLADNSIWGLPEGALCHTPNLSRNNIVEVSEIGLSGNICQLLHLKSLDLSFNKISSFLPGDLSLFPGLSNLDLRGNHLSVLSLTSLSSLWSLAHLDLSDNNLTSHLLLLCLLTKQLCLQGRQLALHLSSLSALGDFLLKSCCLFCQACCLSASICKPLDGSV